MIHQINVYVNIYIYTLWVLHCLSLSLSLFPYDFFVYKCAYIHNINIISTWDILQLALNDNINMPSTWFLPGKMKINRLPFIRINRLWLPTVRVYQLILPKNKNLKNLKMDGWKLEDKPFNLCFLVYFQKLLLSVLGMVWYFLYTSWLGSTYPTLTVSPQKQLLRYFSGKN